ncbi:MAG: putative 4-mercaptohistidine N1-methyltransferase [Chthoniobacterales bacterium]
MRSKNPYENSELLAEYLLLHYGTQEDIFGEFPAPVEALDFPVRTVRELLAPGTHAARALDLGCSVGRSTFEISLSADEIIGIDFSKSFISAAKTMLNEQSISCQIRAEGNIFDNFTARLPADLPLDPPIHFEVGDACDLRSDLGTFDLLHAANLLCRLPHPSALIEHLPDLIRPAGQLLLTTPFTWLEEYTPTEGWIGAQNATAPTSRKALISKLSEHFTLEKEKNIPFIIREHARKFQYTIAWGSRWRRHTSQ